MASNLPLPVVFRFDYGDYTGLGAVFQKFLSNLNLFTVYVYNILNGGIGFANLQRSIYSIPVLAASTTTVSFVNPLNISPSGVTIANIQGLSGATLSGPVTLGGWSFDGKNINIANITGLNSGSNYQLTLEVF